MKFNFKKYLLKFWPVILIFLVWFIFSSPYFIKNKVPFPSTYQVNFFAPWVAYPGFASPVKNNAMPDIISQIYPWKTFTIDSLTSLQMPLWNPYSFSGTPHLANYQSAVLSPFNALFFVLPFIDAWSILILLQPLLAGCFMLLFLRSLKISNIGSAVGSLAFMFCGFIVTWMAYGTLGYAILFLPLALFAIEKYYQTQKNRFLILLSFVFPLSFFSGHFQISIYFLLFVTAYLIFKFFQTKNIPNTSYLILYTFLGLLLSLPQLLPSMELYVQSLRSGIFQKIEVIPWGYFPTLLAPDFLGNSVTRNDWFGHYAEWNSYIGLLPLMLAIYAIFRKRQKEILFFSLTALLAILFSFPTPFLDLLVYLKIPVLSTSAASRIIVIFSFSMSVLAAFGIEVLFKDIKERKIKPILLWITFFALIFISLWTVIALKLFMPIDKILIAKQNFILPTIFFLSSVGVLGAALFLKKQSNPYIFRIIYLFLVFIIAFDLLRFSSKWMPFENKDLVYPEIPVAKEFSKISGYDRVLGNLGQEATTYYKLPSVEGYDALYLKRYGQFIASLQNGKLIDSERSVVLFPKNGLYTNQAVNFLGIKDIVFKIADGHSSWTFPFWNYPDGVFKLLYNDQTYQVLENKNAIPRAFLVYKYQVENNPQKILDKMFNKNFDLRNEVVLEKDPGLKLEQGSGFAKILSYTGNRIIVNTSSNKDSILFLSDTYYPGWEAYIDGKKSKIDRANYTFRAVFVPKGEHNVEFVYEPLSFKLGVEFFIAGLLLIVFLEILKKRKVI